MQQNYAYTSHEAPSQPPIIDNTAAYEVPQQEVANGAEALVNENQGSLLGYITSYVY